MLALVFPAQEDGGAERHNRTLANAAVSRGWEVHAGFPALAATETVRKDLEAMGVRCHSLPLKGSYAGGLSAAMRGALSEFNATRRLLSMVGADAVLLMLPHPDGAPGPVLASAVHRAPTVVVVQMVPTELSFTQARRSLYTASRRIGKQTWVAVSSDNRIRLARALAWSESALNLIYNGASDPGPTTAEERHNRGRDLREHLGLPTDSSLLLTVARLNQQKAYDVIVDSIAIVAATHPNARWLWAGDGPERERLRHQLSDLGVADRVRFLGFRSDVPDLLRAANLLVLPSRYEGQPLALLEALLAELPVVVSDAGPLAEVVRNREHGLVVPVENARALAEASQWALNHPQEMQKMAESGRVRVLANYSKERMVASTLDLLQLPSMTRTAG